MTCEEFYGKEYNRLKEAQKALAYAVEKMKTEIDPEEDLQPIVYWCSRIKSPESMINKLKRRGLPVSLTSALEDVQFADQCPNTP